MSQTQRSTSTSQLIRTIADVMRGGPSGSLSGTIHIDGRGFTVRDLVSEVYGGTHRDYDARAARVRRALDHMAEDLAVTEHLVRDAGTGCRWVTAYRYQYGHLGNY